MTQPLQKFSLLVLSAFLVFGCASSESAQQPDSADRPSRAAMGGPSSGNNGIQAFSDVIQDDFEKDEGLFNVYKDGSTYYYEIPDDILGREMLMVSRIARTADGINYGGMRNNNQVLRWEKRDDQILLRRVSFSNTASDTLPIFEAVRNSNFEPILASFDIKALNEDSTGSVIDVSSLFTTDVPAFGLQNNFRQRFQVRRVDGNRTFIESIRTFPENVEARHVLTYEAANPPSNSDANTITLEINHSMLLLPEEPMERRRPDARIGYFTANQTDFGSQEHRAKPISHITRWELVPKDKEAYLRGELVEPEEPIVFYIDPATPEEWREWLIQGVDDWQEAFEAAGFKNAIYGKMAPEDDPDFSLEDARYPTIRYFASPIMNAFGPHVHDPRSGQIMTSAIGWYHNVMRLLRNWYFVQTAASNPEARATQFDDDVMGELIRFVSAHEVGHTLGLPHNWGSSHAVPVDSLRSPSYTAENGTASSIMDYARFNYIAQPEDGVTNFFPRIGPYDKWAIKWGYTWFGDKSLEEQEEILHEWTKERADDPYYFYGAPVGSPVDPRSQREGLGDDNMYASELGLKNLERITDNMIEWIREDGKDFSELDELYGQILAQWSRYMGHVYTNIAGVYVNDKTFDQEGVVYEPVPRDIQKEAMEFLKNHAFSDPTWQLNSDILDRVNRDNFVDSFREQQVSVLNGILSPQRLARLIEFESRSGSDLYTPFEFMDDVRDAIWTELGSGSGISVYRRNLQRAYVERMEYLMTEELQTSGWWSGTSVNVSQSDIRPIVREQLETLLSDVQNVRSGVSDRASRVHLGDIERRIENILDES